MRRSATESRLPFSLALAVLSGLLLLVLAGGALVSGNESRGTAFQSAPTVPASEGHPPTYAGFVPPRMDLSHLTGERLPERLVTQQALPSGFDWRDQEGENYVSSVKDQGTCGACYAFAALANIESRLLIDGAGPFDFSENNAKECNYGQKSCTGGNYMDVASLFSQRGMVLEACDPYTETHQAGCSMHCPYEKTLLGWRIISGDVVADTQVLKQYIIHSGPIFSAMYAGDGDAWHAELSAYGGSYTLHYETTRTPNHAVLIVGWDDSLEHAGGSGGWIAKNSWGPEWGDGGFFTIAYGSAGMGKFSSFLHEWQDYDSDGDIMVYDEAGMVSGWGCLGKTTAWGLAKFIPASATYVTRVEFWTTDETTDVDVYIYDSFDGSDLSTLLRSVPDLSFAEAGYHSVALPMPLRVRPGDDVVAVVKFTNVTSRYPVPADSDGPFETGRTYLSCSGSPGSWQDLGAEPHPSGEDVAIRLRTSTAVIIDHQVYLPVIAKAPGTGPPTPTPTPTKRPTATPTSTPSGPTPTPTPLPTPPPGTAVTVTNSTTFVPYSGATSTYLVGEVYNASSVSVGWVKIYAMFYDSAGGVVDEGDTFACLHHLAPGMSSPFIDIYSGLPMSSWDHYVLRLVWDAPAYTPLPMEVSSVEDFFDASSAFHVTGDVRNQYDRRLSHIKACVTMRDAAHETIGVWWDNVAALDSGQEDSFDVGVTFWKHKPDQARVADYSLQVYNEYEFLIGDEQGLWWQASAKASWLAVQLSADRERHRIKEEPFGSRP